MCDKTERCKKLVSAIDELSKTEIEEIFKMLNNSDFEYTCNNNGIFINLIWMSDNLLENIEKYVEFCKKSQSEINKFENICDILNSKLIKVPSIINNKLKHNNNLKNIIEIEEEDKNKMSSSMKFYLLKKKYSKTSILSLPYSFCNELVKEPFLIS